MIGSYDFCGHYEWTFEWLRRRGGDKLVCQYWDEAIHRDSQTHALELILEKGIEGMKEYWGHALDEEAAGYHTTATDKVFRCDMHECPSKGFLMRNKLKQYHDYCDHCMGWIGPLLKRGGWVVDHGHNHRGQCWWEMRKASDPSPPSAPGRLSGKDDVRLRSDWKRSRKTIDAYSRANGPQQKAKK
ncbi:MAG: hypothetical protein HY360_23260 [Verrucomicrobia bacterium]|nr:hypothetical protein [Verrucomicrobiota bacterium]